MTWGLSRTFELTGTDAQARSALTTVGLGFLHDGASFVSSLDAAVFRVASPVTSPGRGGNSNITAANPYLIVRFLTSAGRSAVEAANLESALPLAGLALADALVTVRWADFWGDELPFYDARESGVDPARTASQNQSAIEHALGACEDSNGDKLPIVFPRGDILFEKLRVAGTVNDNGFRFMGPGSASCSLLATADNGHAIDVPGADFGISGLTLGVSGSRQTNQYTIGQGDGLHFGAEGNPSGVGFRYELNDFVSDGHPRDGLYCARPEFLTGTKNIFSNNGRYGVHGTDEGQLVGINESIRNWRTIGNKNVGWWWEDLLNSVLICPQGVQNASDISGSATQHGTDADTGHVTNSTIRAQIHIQNGRNITLMDPDTEGDDQSIGVSAKGGNNLIVLGGLGHELHTGFHMENWNGFELLLPHFTAVFNASGRRLYVKNSSDGHIRCALKNNSNVADLAQYVDGGGNSGMRFEFNGLPTSDPSVAGVAWLNSGVYTVSAG